MSRNIARSSFVGGACSIAILCCSVVARAQTVDPAFNPGADQPVLALAVQPDGKIIVGGGFTHLGGVTGTTLRNHIGRLNADGTVDPTFDPGANSVVQAVAVQPDGKILIGGNFTSVGGGTGLLAQRNHIARLNPDGTVDPLFDPGGNGNVYAFAVQPDGKIVVGGEFSTMGGQTRNRLARLNPDGSPDGFDPGVSKPGASAIVYTVALQADGKIVVGGYFNGLGGGTGNTQRNFIGRINADGTLDMSFDPGASSISGVNALAIQADGKILVGGSFTGLGLGNGQTLRGNIGRLNDDGTVDTFNPGAEAQVLTLGVQADGRILAGGYFKWLGGAGNPVTRSVRNYIGRINPDGAVDLSFDPGANNIVNAVAIQGDGAILAAGVFDRVGGGSVTPPGGTASRLRIARIANTDAGVQTLTNGGSFLSWARSGGGPELSYATFAYSFDGTNYSGTFAATRVPGGWRLASGLPSTGQLFIRARGFYGSGFQNGSGSMVELVRNVNAANSPPTITSIPDRAIPVNTTTVVAFTVGDPESGPSGVSVLASSSNTTLVPNANLVLGGAIASRTVTVTPAANGVGITTITLTASDGSLTTSTSFVLTVGHPVRISDFDGDGKGDISVFRPSTGVWYTMNSSNHTVSAQSWGSGADIPVAADYDGDGKTDVAVFRPSSGAWYILRSSDSTFVGILWGNGSDIPVPGDYDGDGKADIAIFRPSDGTWYIRKSSDGTYLGVQFGGGIDVPVPGDYDGDGKTDIAVFRPLTGSWYVLKSSTNTFYGTNWGGAADKAVSADYDGDGKADLAVFRPSDGTWYILQSSTNTPRGVTFGGGTDIPVPADYDGDGKADIAVFRPSTGAWYILNSSDSTFVGVFWGNGSDVPIPRRP